MAGTSEERPRRLPRWESTMNSSSEDRHKYEGDVGKLLELVEEHVQVHQDVIEIDERTWAIHGFIAYDGEVIAATFASANEAWAGLSRLEEIERDVPT
jgi:hypothetical protein